MRLQSLHLENFRAFASREIPFHPQFTVIAGINGRGKTSILDAIAIYLSRVITMLHLPSAGYPKVSESDIFKKSDHDIINLYPDWDPIVKNLKPILRKCLIGGQFSSDNDEPTLLTSLAPIIEFPFRGNRVEYRKEVLVPVRDWANETYRMGQVKRAPIFVYYSVDRSSFYLRKGKNTKQSDVGLGNQTSMIGDSIERKTQALMRVSEHDEYFSDLRIAYSGALVNRATTFIDFEKRFANWKREASVNRSNLSNYQHPVLTSLSETIQKFLEGFSDLDFEESKNEEEALLKDATINIKKSHDDDVLTLASKQLSDGERSLLALVCDLTRRLSLANPTLEDPRMGKGIVLIDEIELHLHPTWQREIVEKLRKNFPNIQFIATYRNDTLAVYCAIGSNRRII